MKIVIYVLAILIGGTLFFEILDSLIHFLSENPFINFLIPVIIIGLVITNSDKQVRTKLNSDLGSISISNNSKTSKEQALKNFQKNQNDIYEMEMEEIVNNLNIEEFLKELNKKNLEKVES